MKTRTRKLTAILISLLMTIAMLSACGGGGGTDTSGGSADGSSAEPNNGLQGIVYTMPDGWTQTSFFAGESSEFNNEDSPYTISVRATTQEMLKSYEGEDANLTIEEYYKKYYTPDKKWMKKNNIELTEMKICGVDAYHSQRNADKGVVGVGASWLYDGVIYDIGLNNYDNYDDQGNFKKDAEPASDEAVAALESVLASVKPGDGNALQNTEVKAESIGSLTFDKPEGFKATNAGDKYIEFLAEEGEASIYVNMSTEEDLVNFTDENGEHPKSLKDEFNSRIYEGIDTIEVGGHQAFIDKYQEEDGNYYMLSAMILTDDALYDVYMQSAQEVYDENGLVEGAPALTDAQVAAFDKFVKSFRDK